MDFTKQLDESKAVDASTVTSSTTPWKERIVEFLIENQASTAEEILTKTDAKYDGNNFTKRKHCLDSQLTYIRQDFNILTKTVDENKIVLLGVVKDKKLIPFKTAEKYL